MSRLSIRFRNAFLKDDPSLRHHSEEASKQNERQLMSYSTMHVVIWRLILSQLLALPMLEEHTRQLEELFAAIDRIDQARRR